MAVVQTKSTLITNFEAKPPKMNKTLVTGGRVREAVATVEVAAADNDLSKYLMIPIFSNWRISSIEIFNDLITVGSDYDVGIFEITGVTVLSTAYASAVTMVAARVAPLDVAFEARDIANIANQVFQDAGLTEDPLKDFYLGFLANTVGSAAGTLAMRARYSDGS